VGDELVARTPHLIRVALAGELEGVRDRLAVDRRGGRGDPLVRPAARGRVELLDDGEEVAEELVLRYVLFSRSRYRRASW
jgi:hypothetical protein